MKWRSSFCPQLLYMILSQWNDISSFSPMLKKHSVDSHRKYLRFLVRTRSIFLKTSRETQFFFWTIQRFLWTWVWLSTLALKQPYWQLPSMYLLSSLPLSTFFFSGAAGSMQSYVQNSLLTVSPSVSFLQQIVVPCISIHLEFSLKPLHHETFLPRGHPVAPFIVY